MSARLGTRALLERLVAFDTTSVNSNLSLAEFVADYVDAPGTLIRNIPSPDGCKTSLLIRSGPERDDRAGLTLSGHMDVVPAGEAGWASDPFAVTQNGETLAGRGTCDMKGFIAVALNEFTARAATALHQPLALLLTYDEELGTLGSRHFVETFDDVASVPLRTIIGEPTGLHPVRMHKGHLKLRVTLEGVASHSGLPHLGRNAIEPAARAILALSELRARWEAERPQHCEHFPDVPYTALNVATVAGGSAINIVPDRCTVHVGIRTMPGTEAGPIVRDVNNALAAAIPSRAYTLELEGDSPPMLLNGQADILTSFGAAPEHDHGASFATDGGWLQRIGCECVLWGPGNMSEAHRPNESVPIADLHTCAEQLSGIVARWCTHA